jgi:hypothetical protein
MSLSCSPSRQEQDGSEGSAGSCPTWSCAVVDPLLLLLVLVCLISSAGSAPPSTKVCFMVYHRFSGGTCVVPCVDVGTELGANPGVLRCCCMLVVSHRSQALKPYYQHEASWVAWHER